MDGEFVSKVHLTLFRRRASDAYILLFTPSTNLCNLGELQTNVHTIQRSKIATRIFQNVKSYPKNGFCI
jgi:hypothetical protein